MARRTDVPAARVVLGQSPGCAVSIFGFANTEYRVPLVELSGTIENMQHLTIQQAEDIAAGLLKAVRLARGETIPTALDAFLQTRKP